MAGILEARPVAVADNCRALPIASPILAGGVAPCGGKPAVRVGASQHVVSIGIVAPAIHLAALFGQSRFLGDVVFVGVKLFDGVCDNDALSVFPWTLADAIACVDAGIA